MERRSSLIMTSPRPSTQPIADSTWIDSTNRPTPPHLRWNLSPKHRSSSSGCLNVSSYSDMQQNNSLHQTSRTSVSKLTRQKLNLSQLDPETFADVHSSGLTSRIVKYQQDQQARANTGGLQRSISFNNVYKPVTQARRTTLAPPLGRKSHLPSIAMTRIAPPERSFYCGNTLPGLLRSNSLVGVEPSNSEQLLRENRPIMHPPPLQHESEPTRSVLEELKEISRKRINSSDMQQPDNKTKKTCNRFADFVDHPGPLPQVHLPIPMNMPPHAQPSFKRNRELSVAVPLGVYHSPLLLPQLQQLFQHPPTHANSVSPQQSPEQQAKRRNCNYSNDIASSLSSSKPHSNKRKLYNMRQKLSQTNISMQSTSAANSSSCSSSSPDTSPSQQAAKIQRKYTTSDYAAEQLSKAQSMPITPLPATPAASVQATLSAPLEQQTAAAAAAKPKLILFNAKQRQQAAGTERTLDFDSPDVDAGEYAGIQFVQPKQQNSLSGKNISMERTQKSKLALMLSSLRGEIYQDEPEPEPTATTTTAAAAADQLDASLPPATALPTPIKPMPIAATTTATVTATTAIKPIILSNVNVTPMPAFNLPASTAATSSVAPTTITTSISMPLLSVTSTGATTTTNMDGKATLPGLKLPTATAAPLLTFNTPATTTTAAPVLTFNSPAATTATAIVSPTLATTNVAAAASAPVFAFGNFAAATKSATPPTFGLTAVTANTTTAAAATATTTTTTTASTAATSNTGMFAFGAAQSVATTTASAPMFAFGNATSTAAATITPAAVTTTTASATPAIFSFGSPAATATPTTTAAAATFSINSPAAATKTTTGVTISSSSNNSMFAFGANNNSNNTASSNSNPGGFASVFKTPAPVGAAAPAATNSAAEANKLFGFGNTTKFTPVTTSAIPSPFATAPKPAATATVAPIFGTAASPMFGTAATTPASTAATNLFSFGGSTEANKSATAAPTTNSGTNLFSFGGAAKDATAASNTNSFGFNAQPAAATAANSNAFGFNAQQTPQFGSSSANNNNTAAAAAKPFAFGATTQQQSAAPAAAANGGFSFSSAAQKSGSTNLFGAPAANPTTGIVKPSFGFGASSTPAAAAAATTAAAPTAAAPTFGGFGAAAPTSSNQNKPFAFGAATNNSTASPIGGNLFASAVSAAQNQAKPASFAFSQAGSNSAATNPNANAPFAFGAAQPQSGGMPKPFAFGAAANSTPAQNLFGSPAAAPAPAASTGAFNFSGMPGTPQQQQQQQQQQQPQINGGNMFAPPSTPENRPIRRATRRLQK